MAVLIAPDGDGFTVDQSAEEVERELRKARWRGSGSVLLRQQGEPVRVWTHVSWSVSDDPPVEVGEMASKEEES